MERRVNINNFLSDNKFIEWQLFKTEELDAYWNSYLEKYPESKKSLDKAISIFAKLKMNEATLSNDDQIDLLNRLKGNLRKHEWRNFWLKKTIPFVASIFLLFTICYYLLSSDKINTEQIVGIETSGSDIQFVNSSIVCNISQNAVIDFSKQDTVLIVDENGEIIQDITTSESVMNKLIIPKGKRSSLILSDGTKVWLNAGAEIEFPSVFKEDVRDVKIIGEAYFVVAKSESKPFIVHSSDIDIKVLGTQFNLSSSKVDQESTVVLVEGSVAVSLKNGTIETMKPNDMLSIVGDEVSLNQVNTSQYTAWKDGFLVFKQEKLKNILKELEKYYDVSFDNINLDFTQNTFSGKLYLSDSLDQILTSIASLTSISFEKRENSYILKSK